MPRKVSPDYWLFLLVLALLGLGVVMVYSASAILATDRFGDAHFFLKKQLFWAVLGLAVMWGVMAVDYRRWRPLVSPLLALAFVLLVLVLIPPFGQSINGTRRWLRWGPISVQPTELAKLVAGRVPGGLPGPPAGRHRQPVARDRAAPGRDRRGGRPGPPPAGPRLGGGHRGGGSLHALRRRRAARPSGADRRAGGARRGRRGIKASYRLRRVLTFLDPWADPRGAGFQIIQSYLALGGGGLLGRGLGESKQKLFYLPEPHTDFIFAILGEELGFAGAVLTVSLFGLLLWRGIRIGLRVADPFGALLAFGVTASSATQAVVNLGVVVGLLPTKGLPLPFVSSGGSSLLVAMAGVGCS